MLGYIYVQRFITGVNDIGDQKRNADAGYFSLIFFEGH
jgi:hypothetical protein